MTKTKSKKLLYVLSFLLSALILVSIAVPIEANAYNASSTVLSDTDYLYNYEGVSYKFTIGSYSYMNLYFSSNTEGYYYVKVVNSSGDIEYSYSDYSYSDKYFYLSKGTYTLYIYEDDNDELYYDVSLYREYNKTIKTTKASISRKKLTLNRYGGYYLYGSYSPSNSTQSGSWKSSNTKVATVSSSGYVYAKNFGKATITYKHGSKKAKCKVTVNKSYLEIGKGKSKSLRKWMKRVKGYKKAKWSSSNWPKVSVSSKGTIYTKKGGQATITAKIKGTKYKVKIYSYDKATLKKKTKKALKDVLYVPSSLKIQTIKFTDFRHCKIYYSAKNLYGVRSYGIWMGYYSYGNFYDYKYA